MGKLLCDSSTVAEPFQGSPSAALPWRDQKSEPIAAVDLVVPASVGGATFACGWEDVAGLEEQQRRHLQKLHAKGVLWKPAEEVEDSSSSPSSSPLRSVVFRLSHGGEVSADGNCLFTASRKAMGGEEVDARELRRRTVTRFLEDLGSVSFVEREAIDEAIRHMYSPDLKNGWGIHVVQEVKLLAKKEDRFALDSAIDELIHLGMQREMAAESIYKERCVPVNDGPSWAKYMLISGSPDDEYDIITLQYTEEGLLSVDENREGRAAAFGDDIAIECLATEFKREIYVIDGTSRATPGSWSFGLQLQMYPGIPCRLDYDFKSLSLYEWEFFIIRVQAHGADAMVDEENCVFFLPHRPRSRITEPPFFLFMKGTGWCGAGADHYEPLIAHPSTFVSQEKVAVVL